MKKKLFITLGLVGIIAGSIAIGAYAASDIKLLINGKSITTDVQVIDGSSYVPLRVVSESLGADVKWDGDSRTISINSKTQASSSTVSTPSPTPTPAVTPVLTSSPIPKPTLQSYEACPEVEGNIFQRMNGKVDCGK